MAALSDLCRITKPFSQANTQMVDFILKMFRPPDWARCQAEQRGRTKVGLTGRHPHRAGGARHQDGGEG